MNVLTVTGNLGRDAEVRPAGGTTVCNFKVAAKAGYGDKEQTLWIRCALWGKRAESGLVPYLVKGQQVAVSGELSTREHEGKTYLECRVNDVTLCGGKQGSSAPAPQQSAQQGQGFRQQPAPRQNFDDFEDDIPFN